MKSMLDIITWVVGLAATVFAIYEYYKFATHSDLQGGHSYLYMAIAATVVAFICALIFFVRRVNKEEEIHITQ
jgi:FtsH-binding integral membrane protein